MKSINISEELAAFGKLFIMKRYCKKEGGHLKSFSIFLLLSVICITIVFVIMNMLIEYPDVSNGALIMIVYIVVTLMIRLYSKKKADRT